MQTQWTISLILCAVCFILTGCKTFDPVYQAEKRRAASLEALHAINVDDGVDAQEARLWGGEYAAKYIKQRVSLGTPEEHGEDWMITLFVGEGTRLSDPMIINKKTGKISYVNHPTVDKPWEVFNQ